MMGIYLDNNATTQPFPEVVSVIQSGLSQYYANPFTQYSAGRDAYKQMEQSRSNIKKMLGIKKSETLLFTSSATESNNILVRGRVAMFPKPPHIIISSTEHSSIYQTCLDLQQSHKCSLSIVPTNHMGLLDIDELSRQVRKHSHRIALVAIILANNETGVIQDIHAIRRSCPDCFLHIDATQYIGKYPIRVSSLNIQSMTFGSHKFHGPRMGSLYLQDARHIRNSCCTGGRSEYGLRSGTPNVAYIMGMEKALSLCNKNNQSSMEYTRRLRDYLQDQLKQQFGSNVRINGEGADRLHNTLSVILPIHGKSKQLVRCLDKHGICVNVGSACNLGNRSRILKAIGLNKNEQASTIRISLSRFNTKKECDQFLSVIQSFLQR